MEQLGSHRTDFLEIQYFRIFRKSVEKLKVSSKSNKNNGYLHGDLCTFMIISLSVVLRMKNVTEKVVERITTYISCWIPPPPENRAVYENMWKNMVQPDRPQ